MRQRLPTAWLRHLNLGAAVLMIGGWAAIWCVATFLPGGHPPLSAYVGMLVLTTSLVVSPLGLIAYGAQKLRRELGTGRRRILTQVAAVLNLLFWMLAVHHLFLRR